MMFNNNVIILLALLIIASQNLSTVVRWIRQRVDFNQVVVNDITLEKRAGHKTN